MNATRNRESNQGGYVLLSREESDLRSLRLKEIEGGAAGDETLFEGGGGKGAS